MPQGARIVNTPLVVTFLLVGLTDEFGLMINAPENALDELSSDKVKSKLLQQGIGSHGAKSGCPFTATNML